jgi:hypothetical protein
MTSPLRATLGQPAIPLCEAKVCLVASYHVKRRSLQVVEGEGASLAAAAGRVASRTAAFLTSHREPQTTEKCNGPDDFAVTSYATHGGRCRHRCTPGIARPVDPRRHPGTPRYRGHSAGMHHAPLGGREDATGDRSRPGPRSGWMWRTGRHQRRAGTGRRASPRGVQPGYAYAFAANDRRRSG